MDGKNQGFLGKNTDRYLGRRPSLAKAGDPEFDSFKVFCVCLFVCWFINPSVYIYIIIIINNNNNNNNNNKNNNNNNNNNNIYNI